MKLINNIILISALSPLALVSCNEASNVKVEYSGALMKIMTGDIKSTISLSELQNLEHVYALGAAEDLQGEIQIFDGKIFHSTVVDSNTVQITYTDNKNASLLVYSSVENWEDVEIPDGIATMDDLEKFVAKTAKARRISEEPFPFLITGAIQSLSWHVINWNTNDKEHTHEKHQASGLNGTLTNATVEIIGFYSEKHKGVFTHHSTNMHLHFKTQDGHVAGHIDDLTIGERMILKLPKRK